MGMGVCKLYLNLSVGGLRVGGRWAASILIDAAWTTHNVHTQRGTHTKRHAMKETHKINGKTELLEISPVPWVLKSLGIGLPSS